RGSRFAPADTAAIGPGVQLATPLQNGAELCTANFLYTDAAGSGGHVDAGWGGGDGGGEHQAAHTESDGQASGVPDGKVYLGAAAHCNAGEDAMSSVDGCKEPVMPEGVEVQIMGRDGKTYTGRVAYNSWVTMQARGETDPQVCNFNDLELIELDDAAVAASNPTVPGFGGPTGLDTDGTAQGEKVFSYQPNQLVATPNKQGTSLGQPEGLRTHVVATVPPGVPGDSGSGYLDADGKAFGVLSSLMAPTTTNGVADIAQALDYAEEFGSVGRISVLEGDAPFSPTVLPLTEMPSGPQLPALPLPKLLPSPLAS
ncbi:MAG: hypothetical protein L0I76_14810, partial [Pseudonocardia sp.]|nr:hypothetical protein [Pseudonocardia sp.]